MASQSSTFGTFLDTYDRLTANNQSPRDATARLLEILNARQAITLGELVSTSGIDVRDLDSAIKKLLALDAIELTGSGLDQSLKVTPKAGQLLDLFK
jgi:hypothetical protein